MVFPFEREAEQGLPMPDGLDLPDQMAYQFLSSLYRDIKAGYITRYQAALDKGKMTYQYSVAKNTLSHSSMIAKWRTDLLHNIESAHTKYIKERTLEAADALSLALDGRMHLSSQLPEVSPDGDK